MKKEILSKKWFLTLTEFFSGMSVMAVELGASRLLAPYFSSSQIVWTIIIGTIMIAMAAGNVWGGRSADRDPNPDRLYRRILFAAVWIAAIPAVGRYVLLGISGLLILAVSTNFLVIAAFLSCMVLFVWPLVLLGTVTPSLTKYSTVSLDDNGRTVGTLGAFNTIGSILGTFLPTFVTIPSVGTSVTFLIFAGILLALSLAYFFSVRRRKAACAAAAVLFAVCAVFGRSDSFAFWEKDLLYEGESVYNYLQVKDSSDRRILSTNVLFGIQSVMMKNDGLTGLYYDEAMAGPAMAGAGSDGSLDILVLGMGTGTYARQCEKYYDCGLVEGVEIDQKISDLSREYFDLPEQVKVTTYDGRAYLAASAAKYDVILVDAYQDITIPFQMSSAEFFTLVRDHLTDNGVMVVNMNMHADGEDSINAWLCDTIAGVFGSVYTADVTGSTNRELFASPSGADLPALLAENASSAAKSDLRSLLEEMPSRMTRYAGGGRILTDDRAPVELLGMRVLDSMISTELGYYRGVFEKGGVQGVLQALA